jgi:glucose/mannose-6-phosphate isomerase
MKNLYLEVAKDVIEINVKGKKRLSKMLYAMLLGDFISVYLAILRNVDPTPIVAITELKDELSRL